MVTCQTVRDQNATSPDGTAERGRNRRYGDPRSFLSQFWSSDSAVMLTMAAVVGVGAGLGTALFIYLIDLFRGLFTITGADLFFFLGSYYPILLPVLGGLLVGPLIYYLAPEAKGHGVPEVMQAMETKGGRIRPRVILVKTVASALTIATGGSVGREGPIVQIGAAFGSTVGQRFHLNQQRILTLVASGSAAGIAATFNAPIAGVMFALEVLLGEYTVQAFSVMVFAAVSASTTSRMFLGENPAFVVPEYSLVSAWELILYLVLGVVAALGAGLFVRVLYFSEDVFDHWRFPPQLKPAVGGLLLGLLGFYVPYILGTGFPAIEDTMSGGLGLSLLLVLVLAKILATSLTLGSGFSGGVFAPALFIGAVLGGSYGKVVHDLFPTLTATSGAYAMVGMAAFFAAAARAPITAIIILFEMTLDYNIMLPLMVSTVVATVVAAHAEPESIYTLKLTQRGIAFTGRPGGLGPMGGLQVGKVMTPKSATLSTPLYTPLSELTRVFQETGHHGLPVVDEEGDLVGMVTIGDLEQALLTADPASTVADIYTSDIMTAFPDESVERVIKRAGGLDIGRIPVVQRDNPRKIAGILRRGDIIRAYGEALSRRDARYQRIERRRLEHLSGSRLIEFELNPHDGAVGLTLKELALPPESLIVSINRQGTSLIPRGNTRLLAGDHLVALAPVDGGARLTRRLRRGAPGPKPPPRSLPEGRK